MTIEDNADIGMAIQRGWPKMNIDQSRRAAKAVAIYDKKQVEDAMDECGANNSDFVGGDDLIAVIVRKSSGTAAQRFIAMKAEVLKKKTLLEKEKNAVESAWGTIHDEIAGMSDEQLDGWKQTVLTKIAEPVRTWMTDKDARTSTMLRAMIKTAANESRRIAV